MIWFRESLITLVFSNLGHFEHISTATHSNKY